MTTQISHLMTIIKKTIHKKYRKCHITLSYTTGNQMINEQNRLREEMDDVQKQLRKSNIEIVRFPKPENVTEEEDMLIELFQISG